MPRIIHRVAALPLFLTVLHSVPVETTRQADIPDLSVAHHDDTPGSEWIRRLERPNRLAGLKVQEVIAALGLRAGDAVADIGAGTGAFAIPFAAAVGPSGRAFAVDIWPELLEHIRAKATGAGVVNLQTILGDRDDPRLPAMVDLVFFHDVFHNLNDRAAYIRTLRRYLNPGGRIAIVEQEFDDPIAVRWDRPEDRITAAQVDGWMADAGFQLVSRFDLFQGPNNPADAGMPERWFVVYGRRSTR